MRVNKGADMSKQSIEKQFCQTANAVDKIFKEREKEDKLAEQIQKAEARLEALRDKARAQVAKRVQAAHKADDLEHELYKRIRAIAECDVLTEPSEVKNAAFSKVYEQLENLTGRKIDYRIS